MSNNSITEPFIPASKSLPEITIRGTLLAIVLTVVLASANAFLGLKVGLTVSASIPAAVISMGILRFFKNSNILENNIVQTAASAGEALTAGISFTLPALIVIHYWDHFNYWSSFIVAVAGGTMGVLFSVPLRRVLLADKTLRFPEGTAIGKVLMASAEDEEAGFKNLIAGGAVGALISICQTGFKLLADHLQLWFKAGSSVVGFGFGFAPALIGAGYIIGISTCLSIFLGVVLGWVIGVPVLTHIYGIPADKNITDVAMLMWSEHIRYIGLGAMMLGGIWAVFSLLKPISVGIATSVKSVIDTRKNGAIHVPRTERDLSILTVLWLTLLALCPIYFLVDHFTSAVGLQLTSSTATILSWVSVLLIVVVGFALASVCGYFAGLVGSSANPLSSLALISLIIVSFVVLLFLSGNVQISKEDIQGISAAALAILITAIIASTACICNDTIQDLKAGQMVGATPWKQQIMLILGVIVAALSIPLILQLLFDAYGLGGVMPRPNMDPSQMLLAPQAGLMAAIVQGIFTHDTQWSMIITGASIAAVALVIDKKIEKYGWRLPVLAVGIGIYLPVDTSMALVTGGILSYIVDYFIKRKHAPESKGYKKAHQSGLMLACGLVAGAAVMGVVLAIPFAIKGSSDVLRLMPTQYSHLAGFTGLTVTILLCVWVAARVVRVK